MSIILTAWTILY